MRALETEVVDADLGRRSSRCCRPPPAHPLGCHRPRVPDRLCFWGVPDPPGDRRIVGRHRSDPRPSGVGHHAAGPPRRVDRGRRVRPAQRRSARRVRPDHRARPRPRSPSTGRCTKRPTAAKEPAPTPLIGRSWAGSGRSRSTVTASRSAGRSTAPTATTCACSNPPSTPSPPTGCSSTSTPCISTAATTTPPSATGSPARARPTSSSSAAAPRTPATKQPLRLGLRWIVEATNTWWSNYGQLRRNTDRAAATATPPSASPPPCSSSEDSSPGATAGARPDRLSAQVLRPLNRCEIPEQR